MCIVIVSFNLFIVLTRKSNAENAKSFIPRRRKQRTRERQEWEIRKEGKEKKEACVYGKLSFEVPA